MFACLCRLCVGNHRCCEFVNAEVLACPDVIPWSSLNPVSPSLYAASPKMVPERGVRGMEWILVCGCTPQTPGLCNLTNSCLCVNHCPLNKETSPMRSESCSNRETVLLLVGFFLSDYTYGNIILH